MTRSGWAFLILLALAAWQIIRDEQAAPRKLGEGAGLVERVIDGDTLLLADGRRVRLLGVDTPETKKPDTPVQPFGIEAWAFTREHVEGKPVRLEFDKERVDKYGRVLAYVYRDDWLLNEELIRAGFSRAITKYPYSEPMKRRFRAAEQEARDAQRGIWSTAK
jgi:micrococcal nuclease